MLHTQYRCSSCNRHFKRVRFPFKCICGHIHNEENPVCIHRGQEVGNWNCKCEGVHKIHTCSKFGHCAPRPYSSNKEVIHEDGTKTVLDSLAFCSVCEEFTSSEPVLIQLEPKISRKCNGCEEKAKMNMKLSHLREKRVQQNKVRISNARKDPTMIPVPSRRNRKTHLGMSMNDTSILTEQELARDSIILAGMIASRWPECDGIAGVPRSGMIAASLVATNLGLPLFECSKGILEAMGGGRRMRRAQRSIQSKIVVIEDSVNTGWALENAVGSPRDPRIIGTASVYCTPQGEPHVDLFAIPLPLPHWFTWHMFGSNLLSRCVTGFDFDGILGHDSSAEDDDDGDRYINWLQTVHPLYLYKGGTINYIITGRIEKYRSYTEQWLAKHNQKYDNLIMGPWSSKRERSRHRVGEWKGEMILKHGIKLYVESDPIQAVDIHRVAGIPVMCPAARKVFA